MKKLNFKFGLLFSKNIRSYYYLDILKKYDFIPSTIIEFPNNKISKKINQKHKFEIKKKKDVYRYFKKKTDILKIDNKKNLLIDNFLKSDLKYFIFAGNYGQILPKDFFKNKKKIIHVHPGDLPSFKGSTTHYYEYLLKNRITYTSIFLSEHLDSGKIIFKKKYNPNKINFSRIDDYYDPSFRSETLIQTLQHINKNKIEKNLKKNKNIYKDYYVIHPLLKHLSIIKSKF